MRVKRCDVMCFDHTEPFSSFVLSLLIGVFVDYICTQVTAEDIFANNGGTLAHLGEGRGGKRVATASSLIEFGQSSSHRNSRAEDSMSSGDSDDDDDEDDDDDDDDKLLANAVSAAAHLNKNKSSLNTKGAVLLGGVLAGGKAPASQRQPQLLQPQPTAKAVAALRKTLKKGLSSFATNPEPGAVAAVMGKAGKKGGGVGNSSSSTNGRTMVSASALEGRFVAAGSLSSGGSLAGIKPIHARAQRSAAASLRALDSDQVGWCLVNKHFEVSCSNAHVLMPPTSTEVVRSLLAQVLATMTCTLLIIHPFQTLFLLIEYLVTV